jgi:hypothetical protein
MTVAEAQLNDETTSLTVFKISPERGIPPLVIPPKTLLEKYT